MTRTDFDWLLENGCRVHSSLHDELIVEVPRERLVNVLREIGRQLETSVQDSTAGITPWEIEGGVL